MRKPETLFVLGLPRSGTHLLRFALEKSPDIAFVPETAVLYKYWGSRRLGRFFGRSFVARVLARSIVTGHGDPTMADFMHREHAIAAAVQAKPTLRAIGAVLQSFFDNSTTYLGEKSPNNTLYIRDVIASEGNMTGAKLVVIQRNPHDQIASSVRTEHIGGGLITALARHHAYRKALEGVEFYQVDYEELVVSPESTLRDLCSYLGIAFHWEMLRPGVLDSSESANFFQLGDFGFIPDNIGRGRERLGHSASATIDEFLAHGPSSLNLFQRIAFHWHVILIEKNRLMARLGIVMLKSVIKVRVMGLRAV